MCSSICMYRIILDMLLTLMKTWDIMGWYGMVQIPVVQIPVVRVREASLAHAPSSRMHTPENAFKIHSAMFGGSNRVGPVQSAHAPSKPVSPSSSRKARRRSKRQQQNTPPQSALPATARQNTARVVDAPTPEWPTPRPGSTPSLRSVISSISHVSTNQHAPPTHQQTHTQGVSGVAPVPAHLPHHTGERLSPPVSPAALRKQRLFKKTPPPSPSGKREKRNGTATTSRKTLRTPTAKSGAQVDVLRGGKVQNQTIVGWAESIQNAVRNQVAIKNSKTKSRVKTAWCHLYWADLDADELYNVVLAVAILVAATLQTALQFAIAHRVSSLGEDLAGQPQNLTSRPFFSKWRKI